MPGISIDRLTLQVPGFSESDAHRLALAVAGRLSTAALSAGASEVSALRIELTARPGQPTDRLADRIVAEISQQLARLP
jgi:hypothetical protein